MAAAAREEEGRFKPGISWGEFESELNDVMVLGPD